MRNRQYEYRIQNLEKRYSETNVQKGEMLSPSTKSKINKTYYDNQRKRRVDGILNHVKNKDSIKEEVHQIISEIPSLKQLCNNCKEELIISVIILYVLKSRNPRYHIDRNGLWEKYEITWQKYSLILGRLLQETRKSTYIK